MSLNKILIKDNIVNISTLLSIFIFPFKNVYAQRIIMAIVYKINKWNNEI